jgi:hypothetical protein
MLMAEPQRATFLILIELPIEKKSRTDPFPPKREVDRSDRVDPSSTWQRIESSVPARRLWVTEILEPMRVTARKLRIEPNCVYARVDISWESLADDLTEIADPRLTWDRIEH